jgi:hypothetical protein
MIRPSMSATSLERRFREEGKSLGGDVATLREAFRLPVESLHNLRSPQRQTVLLCEFPALNINCRRASNKDTTPLTKQKLRYISVLTTDSELETFTLESELRSQ